jgi:hypothetical protein
MERSVRERADPSKKSTILICIFMMEAHLETADCSNRPLLIISNVCLSVCNIHLSPFHWCRSFMYLQLYRQSVALSFLERALQSFYKKAVWYCEWWLYTGTPFFVNGGGCSTDSDASELLCIDCFFEGAGKSLLPGVCVRYCDSEFL